MTKSVSERKQINVFVPDDLLHRLDVQAAKQTIATGEVHRRSDVVRELLARALDEADARPGDSAEANGGAPAHNGEVP